MGVCGEVEIRGVKDGMKGEKRKMTHKEFHEAFGHVGPCAGCTVCKSVKGTMRKILKKVDPHRETRMGYMSRCGQWTFAVFQKDLKKVAYILLFYVIMLQVHTS